MAHAQVPGPEAQSFPVVPFRQYTPGSLCTTSDGDFTQYRYRERIPYCERNVSVSLKKKIFKLYQVPARCESLYTIDHFYPLSLGGSNHPDNLWPEHKDVKTARQDVEFKLYQDLKNGRITQAQALAKIEGAKMNPPLADGSVDTCSGRSHPSYQQIEIEDEFLMNF